MRKSLIFMLVCVALVGVSTSYSNGVKNHLNYRYCHGVIAIGIGLATCGIYDLVNLWPEFERANIFSFSGSPSGVMNDFRTHCNLQDNRDRVVIKRLALSGLKLVGGVVIIGYGCKMWSKTNF